MSAPRVSVIIPAYNREAFISQAVESVLAQREVPLECIVVDDGSSDGTAAVLEGFGEAIRVIRQENAGRSAARNRGLAEARAEWVAFLDSDDSWKPGKLAAQLALHEARPELVLSGHGIEVAHADGRVEAQPPRCDLGRLSEEPYEAVLDDFAFFPSVVMTRREDALAVGGFDVRDHGAEDLDFALRLALRGPVAVLLDCLTRMTQHGGQTGKRQLAEMNVQVAERHLAEFAERFSEARKAKLREKLGRYMLSIAKRCEGADRVAWLKRAVETNPKLRWKTGYWNLRLRG